MILGLLFKQYFYPLNLREILLYHISLHFMIRLYSQKGMMEFHILIQNNKDILTICGNLAAPTSDISLVNFLMPGDGTLSSSSPAILFKCSLLFFVGLLSSNLECFFEPLDYFPSFNSSSFFLLAA